MEIWLEFEAGKTIFFNGKVARVVMPDDKDIKKSGPGIAIRIIQISPEQQHTLNEFLASKPQNQHEDQNDELPIAS